MQEAATCSERVSTGGEKAQAVIIPYPSSPEIRLNGGFLPRVTLKQSCWLYLCAFVLKEPEGRALTASQRLGYEGGGVNRDDRGTQRLSPSASVE